ncbi:MAG TPA: glycosyltransferase [Levilinea sp.]|nr:glycosyltransferase [Levilinea sp.]
MRVLYFTRDFTGHDHRFLSALARTDHQVYVLRLERRNSARAEQMLPGGVEQIDWMRDRVPFRWQHGPALVNDLKKVIDRVQPDLVHAGTVQTAAFLTALSGFKPLVTMTWGSDLLVDADRNWLWRWATHYTLARTSVLVGDCKAVQDKAARFGFSPERTVIFPWGVDLDRFQPGESKLRKQLGWEDRFVLLSLRSWEPIYGVDLLVRAFLRTAHVVPQMRLLLLGEGAQAARLHSILASSELRDRVYLAGHIDHAELPQYYRAADLYVSASYSDGSSVSLLESLACACPVLVSDIPGNLEWIEEGRQGWLFPTGNEEALANAMQRASEQRARLSGMAQACRCLAEARANWEKNFEKLLVAYDLATNSR